MRVIGSVAACAITTLAASGIFQGLEIDALKISVRYHSGMPDEIERQRVAPAEEQPISDQRFDRLMVAVKTRELDDDASQTKTGASILKLIDAKLKNGITDSALLDRINQLLDSSEVRGRVAQLRSDRSSNNVFDYDRDILEKLQALRTALEPHQNAVVHILTGTNRSTGPPTPSIMKDEKKEGSGGMYPRIVIPEELGRNLYANEARIRAKDASKPEPPLTWKQHACFFGCIILIPTVIIIICCAMGVF